jgi:cytochrome c biogenesis protein CcmG/thiol:disulfide interchange protein DsbE
MRRSIWAVVVAAPLVWLLASGFGRNPNTVHSPLVNHRAPAFSLRDFSGRSVSLASLRGRPVVVNFWASWCLSCKDEHPVLMRAWHTYGRQVAFVGVDYQDHISDARAFLARYGRHWVEVSDPSQQTAIDYGVYGVPETFFIDRRGTIQYKSTGPVTWGVVKHEMQRILG